MGMLASLTFCLLLLEEEEEPFAEEEDIVRRFSVFSSCRYLSFEGFPFSELFLFDDVVFLFSLLDLSPDFFGRREQKTGQLLMKFHCFRKNANSEMYDVVARGGGFHTCSSLTCLHVLHVSTYRYLTYQTATCV